MSDTRNESPTRGMALHNQILLALFLGVAVGMAVNLAGWSSEPWLDALITYVMRPVRQVFLNLLLMTVVPLVFASLALGVAQLAGMGNLGRIALKTFAFFVLSMSFAVAVGLGLVNTVRPGVGLSEETTTMLLAEFGKEAAGRAARKAEFGIDTFVSIVTPNPIRSMAEMDMLGVIFFALLIGVGLTSLPDARKQLMMHILEGINELMVKIIGWAMVLAPYGVFASLFLIISKFGFTIVIALGWYVIVVLAGLALQLFVVLAAMVAILGRMNPIDFFRRTRAILLMAFSTSSSNATLPTSIRISQQELGIPGPIAGFVLPLGATMNMNGTALFEGVTVVFLAQVFGIPLSIDQQLIVLVMAVLTAIGAAGVPGGSLPLLIMVLAMVNVPTTGIAIILGVDRILDMCRTTLNVLGDVAAATYVTRSEGFALKGEAASASADASRPEAAEPPR